MKLNLGCGQNQMEGYVNVDKFASCGPDIVWDLESFPWPFESDVAEEVVLRHCLEHMGGAPEVFLSIMRELYRVSAPRARIVIDVPHPRSDSYLGDPTHVRPVTPGILSLFSRLNNQKAKDKGWSNTPLALYLDVDFDLADVTYKLMPQWLKAAQDQDMSKEAICFAIDTYFNVVDEISIVLIVNKEPRS